LPRVIIEDKAYQKNKRSVMQQIVVLTLLAFAFPFTMLSQKDSTLHQIHLNCAVLDENSQPVAVLDENSQPVSNIIIVNKRTRTGTFGKSNGRFEITCLKSDTLSVTSLGFYSREITFKDSIYKPAYSLTIFLETRVFRVATVEVFAPRDLEKIQDDINKLGYDKRDYITGDPIHNPITFLYEQFSRRERSKRLVAQLENEDLKRDLLKELFHHYVDYNIIELSDDEFDDFIDFINVSDEFLKSSSQYDF